MLEPLIPRLKREIEARLAELRPVVTEVERLEAAKEAMLAEAAAESAVSRRSVRPSPAADRAAFERSAFERFNGSATGAPARPEATPARSEAAPARPEAAPARPEAAPARPEAAPVRPEATPTRSEPEAESERAPRGPNQIAILAIVEERPGVSVAEIAAVTKIAKPTVATTVSKLKREGVLTDEAGGVKLASRQPITLSQITAAATRPGAPRSSRDEGASDEEWEAARRGRAPA